MPETLESIHARLKDLRREVACLKLAASRPTAQDKSAALVVVEMAQCLKQRVLPLEQEILASEAAFPNESAFSLTLSLLYDADSTILTAQRDAEMHRGEPESVLACLSSLAAEAMEKATRCYRQSEWSVD